MPFSPSEQTERQVPSPVEDSVCMRTGAWMLDHVPSHEFRPNTIKAVGLATIIVSGAAIFALTGTLTHWNNGY